MICQRSFVYPVGELKFSVFTFWSVRVVVFNFVCVCVSCAPSVAHSTCEVRGQLSGDSSLIFLWVLVTELHCQAFLPAEPACQPCAGFYVLLW